MSKNDETVELAMYIHHETDRAILASDDGEKKHAKWYPKSQIEIAASESDDPNEWIVTFPEWLATKNGLV